jgi:hypothetical protein
MATTKLKLRPDRNGRDGKLTIYIQVCIDTKVKLFSTEQSCLPSIWDEKNQRIKKTSGSNDHVKLNMVLEKASGN